MGYCGFVGFYNFVANSEKIMKRLSTYLVAICLNIIAVSAHAADGERVKTYVEKWKAGVLLHHR